MHRPIIFSSNWLVLIRPSVAGFDRTLTISNNPVIASNVTLFIKRLFGCKTAGHKNHWQKSKKTFSQD